MSQRSPSGSKQGSVSGRVPTSGHSRQISGATSGPAAGGTPATQPPDTSLGYDPARPGGIAPPRKDADNRNIDLPPEAYAVRPLDTDFPRRPGFNNDGKPATIHVNQFRVTKVDTSKKIYQYDVSFSPQVTKPGPVFKKCWAHRAVQEALSKYKVRWLYDGRKLAWAPILVDRGELRITVDLDEGRPHKSERKAHSNTFLFVIRKTTEINISVLPAYLRGTMGWDDSVLECMNFLDHAIRQYPSEQLIAIKRNFYSQNSRRMDLESFIDVTKGIYASIRMNQSIHQGGMGLGLNLDVSNTAFWKGGMSLANLMLYYLRWVDPYKWGKLQLPEMANVLRPVYDRKTDTWSTSDAFKSLRKLHKLRFRVNHHGKTNDPKVCSIFKFEFKEGYGHDGANAHTVKFPKDGKDISVYDYMVEKYQLHLRLPLLPLVSTTRSGWYPAEVCIIEPDQRYPFKLDGEQTSKMIKFAVTRPDQRRADIMSNRDNLKWNEDPYLRQYGIAFDPNFAKVPARVLPNPEIKFLNAKHNPGVSGRWDLRGKKFLEPNTIPLEAWGFVLLERAVTMPVLQAFAQTFSQVYTQHGGRIGKKAVLIDQGSNPNHAEALNVAYKQVMQENKGRCQLIFCVLRAKNSGGYERLKKSGDCRFGIMTQMIQGAHVTKNQQQYHSNVAMKVNAKLGGVTCKVPHPSGDDSRSAFFPRPTMIIGADVSHAAPGSQVASMAAMTMSINKDATRYAAACDTNGHRVEMLKAENIHVCLNRLLPVWRKNVRAAPQHIYYFRDGVAESQYIQVLAQEVDEIKRYFQKQGVQARFTVIIATKRHHIRFFPEAGDRNKNALPGTLVEREVTHPFQWDFYLCSHVAIQGTARPVHYSVILDEAGCKPEELQKMLYQHCYQYIRSTTPVSLYPAVYYAHLASNRARFHEAVATSEGFRSGGKAVEVLQDKIAKGVSVGLSKDTESLPLMLLGGSEDATDENRNWIRNSMWYI